MVLIAGLISAAFLLPLLFFLHDYYIPVLIIGAAEQVLLYPVIVALIGAAGREELKVIGDVTGSIPIINRVVDIFTRYTKHFMCS